MTLSQQPDRSIEEGTQPVAFIRVSGEKPIGAVTGPLFWLVVDELNTAWRRSLAELEACNAALAELIHDSADASSSFTHRDQVPNAWSSPAISLAGTLAVRDAGFAGPHHEDQA